MSQSSKTAVGGMLRLRTVLIRCVRVRERENQAYRFRKLLTKNTQPYFIWSPQPRAAPRLNKNSY